MVAARGSLGCALIQVFGTESGSTRTPLVEVTGLVAATAG